MEKPARRLVVERVIFTVAEHLKVQLQVERRAHELWCAGGFRDGNGLSDWLRAEGEVLEQFIWAYARQHALRRCSRQGPSVSVARRKSETRAVKRGQAVAAKGTLSALA